MTGILAVDPGGTTGFALAFNGKIQATGTTKLAEEIWSIASRDAFDVIVVERFTTSGVLSKYGLLTIEIVGGLRAIAHLYGKTLVLHMPQHRLAYQTDAKTMLKEMGVHFVIHEVDALSHLLAYQARMREVPDGS
jgi:hypothetical protein